MPGLHGMYTMLPYCFVAWSISPVCPIITDVSTYTGYDGSCTADVTPEPNIICSRPMSHFEPSETKISSGAILSSYRLDAIFSRSGATPFSGP